MNAKIGIWLVLALPMLGVVAGCSTYTDHTREAQRAVADGELERATRSLNEHLDVEQFDGKPRTWGDDKVLLLLERATLLQALGEYEAAARDMQLIDEHLEFLDLGSSTADDILSVTYSADAGDYQAPPHERLLLNTMNMINFLAMGQGDSARVEARRFDVMKSYYLDTEPDEVLTDILGLGNYVAGVAFEEDESFREAVRYYTEAYSFGVWPEADDDRLLDLINLTGYSGRGLGERRGLVGDLFERAEGRRPKTTEAYREAYLRGDTLIVVQTGLVPYRESERIGLDRAVDKSRSSPYSDRHLDREVVDGIDHLRSSDTLNWLNTTRLADQGLPTGRSASVTIDATEFDLRAPIDVSEQIIREWNDIADTALAAAIARAVTREAVSEGVSQGVEAISDSGALGSLVGLVTSTSLAAADTPDTRSWTSLPDDIHLMRLQLPSGSRSMEVEVDRRRQQRTVEISDDRFQLLNFSKLR